MKFLIFTFTTLLLLFGVESFTLLNANLPQLGGDIFNNTQLPSGGGGGILNSTGIGSNIPAGSTGGGSGACYATYAQTMYQILVVGGAKLRFCVQNATKDVAQAATVGQCERQELSNISAQLNLAADKFTICSTMAAL